MDNIDKKIEELLEEKQKVEQHIQSLNSQKMSIEAVIGEKFKTLIGLNHSLKTLKELKDD